MNTCLACGRLYPITDSWVSVWCSHDCRMIYEIEKQALAQKKQ